MQKRNWQPLNWQSLNRAVVAAATVAVVACSTFAVAQREDAHALFAAAPKVNTSVAGVHAFPDTPSGFNIMTASNRELLTYGLPQRPDKATDAHGYDRWEKAMSALQSCNQRTQSNVKTTSSAQACHGNDVKAMPFSSRNAQAVPGQTEKLDGQGTSSVSYFNWSGIAQTNANKSWNTKTSFDEVCHWRF